MKHRLQRHSAWFAIVMMAIVFLSQASYAQTLSAASADHSVPSNPFSDAALANHRPWEIGATVQGGNGLTEDRDSFHFLMAGVHLGKVLTPNLGPGLLRGNFEYAAEVLPFWQAYSPKFQRANCVSGSTSNTIVCSSLYETGGTYNGTSIVPIILRWNLTGSRHFSYWAQGAGGVVWTNHKFPAFGSPTPSLSEDGPNTDTSVFNFTPQFGVGMHYFIRPNRSIDFGANAVHLSSSSLGDKNPGINASVQFSLGYTWWK